MEKFIITLMILSLLGCNHYIHVYKHGLVTTDTIVITDTIVVIPINPYPGFILPVDHRKVKDLGGIWMQWTQNGQWHRYTLNDSIR